MKRTLEVLLTAFVLAAMYGVTLSPSAPSGNSLVRTRAADLVTLADGTDPMPICRHCKIK